MRKKVYAIKEGYDFYNKVRVQNKVVDNWEECCNFIKGVKGAKYKSFKSIEEAKEYLKDDKKLIIKGVDSYPQNCIHIYVDGSYNTTTGKYSYAILVAKNGIIKYLENGVAEDNSNNKLRQILGELNGAIKAFEYAIENKIKDIVLFHDYEGIFHHAVGTWNRKDISSQTYYNIFNKYKEKYKLNVTFVKVDSHTGDIFNEIVDNYAKLVAGIEITNAIDKELIHSYIKVENKKLKNQLKDILKDKSLEEKIIIEKL